MREDDGVMKCGMCRYVFGLNMNSRNAVTWDPLWSERYEVMHVITFVAMISSDLS